MSGNCPVERNDILTINGREGLWRVTKADPVSGEFDTEYFADPDKLTHAQKFMLNMWGYDAKRLLELSGSFSA